MDQKGPNWYFIYQFDRKMEIKSSRYFEVNYLSMKLLSQNFEVLTQCGIAINPKMPQKMAQINISCTNCDRKMKIKSNRNFEKRYLFMKLFP